MSRRRKHWGWGFEDEQPRSEDLGAMATLLREQVGFEAREVEEPVPLEAVTLPSPRLAIPEGDLYDTSVHARATHAQGKALADIVGGLRGQFPHPPDAVARPRDEADIEAVLEWAAAEGAKVIPYGGGTSVVGGIEPRFDEPAISLDLGALDALLQVDDVSR